MARRELGEKMNFFIGHTINKLSFIGHTLNELSFNEEEKTLSLTLDGDKVFLLKVEADCCSQGKFIGLSEQYALNLPSKIVDIKEKSANFNAGDDFYQVYQETWILENGCKLNIVYDNLSNGYYGSSLDAFYGGEIMWEFPKEKIDKSI